MAHKKTITMCQTLRLDSIFDQIVLLDVLLILSECARETD